MGGLFFLSVWKSGGGSQKSKGHEDKCMQTSHVYIYMCCQYNDHLHFSAVTNVLLPSTSKTCALFCVLAFSSSTLRQKLQSRGEACGGLEESVFKGVSTPNFCIIHVTPQRWSISRLHQESCAISWRDAALEDIGRLACLTQVHIHEISYTPRAASCVAML